MRSVAPHPQLQLLSIKEIVCLMFIVWCDNSPLRWQTPGMSDLDAVRAEFRRREWEVGGE